MKSTKIGEGRMNRTLTGLGDNGDYVGDLPTVDDPVTFPDVTGSGGVSIFDPTIANPAAWEPIDWNNIEAGMTMQNPNAVMQNAKDAAALADTQPGVPVKIAGSNESVVSVAKAPTNPDPMTWYKVGSTLMKATGQRTALGLPVYQRQSLGMSSTMIAGIAALAFFFLS